MKPDPIEDLVKQRIAESSNSCKPRLRFDKVALQFLETVKAGLSEAVPDGKTVILTIAAPIRLASKTAADLQADIRARLTRAAANADWSDRAHGNHIRVRILNSNKKAPKVLGYVHSPDPDAAQTLLDMTQSLL